MKENFKQFHKPTNTMINTNTLCSSSDCPQDGCYDTEMHGKLISIQYFY